MTTAELLEGCQFWSGRPSTDAQMTPAKWYTLLTYAQKHWTNAIASKFPQILYGAPVLLESDDNGETFRLPLVSSAEVFPIGLAEVRASRGGTLLTLGPEFANVDLTPEGTKLRVPHGKTRSFPDGPYMRYVSPAGVINGSTEPTLPAIAHPLLVFHACWLWAARPPQPTDPGFFKQLEQTAWLGDPHLDGDDGIAGALASQYLGQDGAPDGDDSGAWWASADLR